MNYGELQHYISDLQQGGFDVVRLRVQLQKKLAYPVDCGGDGDSCGSLCAFRGTARRNYGHRHCRLELRWCIGQCRPVRSDGQCQPAAADAGGLVAQLIFALVGGYLILKVPT